MPRTHGYSTKGERCYGVQDWGAKGRTNVIGALLGTALITISLFACSIDTQTFTGWFMQDLLPKLPAKSVIILDNASFHKGADMLNAAEKAGHTLLYLPPYSPDFNPIEHKWAQAKAMRRKYRCDIQQLFTRYLV
jgi:transposase